IEEQGLSGYKLVIFPYSAVWHPREVERIVEYVQGGGKLMCFYVVPKELRGLLGLANYSSRRENYPGELRVMQFVDDRPPGFPAQVHQDSPNLSVVTASDAGRVIANWYDKDGKDTGLPAVVLSSNGVYVSHVFKSGNPSEQTLLVLATLGHFIPGSWERIVQGVLEGAASGAGYETLDALARACAGHPRAVKRAAEAAALQEQARAALADRDYEHAMNLARASQEAAQRAVIALFPSRPCELRGVWMSFPNDATDWETVMSELEAANFNALFPLMSDGTRAAFPSDYLKQVTEHDQLQLCIEAAHRHGIEVHPWRVNWCILGAPDEERQALVDAGLLVLSVDQARGEEEREKTYRWSRSWRDPSAEINRELEFNVMTEMVEKYDVDGIHFDYMRYPSKYYCYCDRCRAMFEEWAGVKVENWPDDCWDGGKYLKAFRDWRRMLQTSLVKRIAERARELDPDIKISLAARASVTGAPENDAQDWMTWARLGYLDMLCPMDYTSSVDVLRRKLEPQIEVIDGVIPVYAGIGVSPTRSSSPVNLSQQIIAARELGADGFLLFALSQFTRNMLPAIAEGVTSHAVTIMPQHTQPVHAVFRYPDGIEGAPARTYEPGAPVEVGVRLEATRDDVDEIEVHIAFMPAAGGKEKTLAGDIRVSRRRLIRRCTITCDPGVWQIILRGHAITDTGERVPFYLRSRPLNILTPEATAELLARLNPPVFKTDRAHVGVFVGGYGSDGITELLSARDDLEVQPIYQITAEFLADCDVLVLPQPVAGPDTLKTDAMVAVREFVRGGGGLLATHDAVGSRGHPALFPELVRGGERVRARKVTLAGPHAMLGKLEPGTAFEHSYYDHIQLISSGNATIIVRNEDGNPVVVCGEVGKGRYVAWGMVTGLSDDGRDITPGGPEAELLINAVRWLSGRE
ncbi:MAG: family 10 glycosylhydrolase, partial [Armatimonadetes bacterium]|nr:family 10 glycosylhydrolase [Armatimonadota bacterium]